MPHDSRLDTFPKLLLDRTKQHPHKIAMREKDLGIWQAWTWHHIYDEVRTLACGLAAMVLARADKVAIIGDNRPQLYWTMIAAQCLGGVPVPLYQDAVPEEMQFVLEHAETRFAVAEDQEQVDKLLAVRTAMAKFGNKLLTGEQARWGFEHLDLTEARLKELGLEGFVRPIKVTCADHEGNGPVFIQQWDGKQWKKVTDWISPMREVVRPQLEQAAADYAKENNITPRTCASES